MLAALRLACAALVLLACSERRHPAHGIVRDVHRPQGQVVIEHEDIPGLMPAMTMNFDVEPQLLDTLQTGQVIDFSVVFADNRYAVTDVVVVGEAEPDPRALTLGGVAGLWSMAPGFELVDQDGQTVTLDQLRGSFVLLDFVYTTCPGPCPILTSSHVSLQRMLPAELSERTRFVSITLDPANDTPEKLRAYGEARGADLASWSFLTGSSEAVDAILRAYGVGSVRRADGTIDHLVVTFLIDEQGRIAERWVGLDHATRDLLRDLERRSG